MMKKKIYLAMVMVILLGLNITEICYAANSYPDRDVTLVVPFGAGGISDRVARVVAQYVSKDFGQPVVVLNKPGGSGIPGTAYTLNSRPDGYTLQLVSIGATNFAIAASPDIPYTWDQLTSIARVNVSGFVFSVKADTKWQTLKDVVDDVRKDPRRYKYSNGGIVGPSTFATCQLFDSVGIDPNLLIRVTFTGGAESSAALAGGNVDFASLNLAEVIPLVKAGKLRALAITTTKRSDQLPETPTSSEAGYPNYTMTNWNGVIGPKGLPEYVVKRWNEALQRAMKDNSFLDTLKKTGVTPAYLGPKDYMKVMKETYETGKYFVEKLGLKKVTK